MMGASDLFNMEVADLSGMKPLNLENEKLHVSSILHKCFIEVNEEGTEAAAVTSISSRTTSSPMKLKLPKVFKCDRPFLLFIHDNEFNTILFMGRCSKPKQYSRRHYKKKVSPKKGHTFDRKYRSHLHQMNNNQKYSIE
jgi:serpin B8